MSKKSVGDLGKGLLMMYSIMGSSMLFAASPRASSTAFLAFP